MEREIEWLLKEKYHGEKTAGFFTDCERLQAGEPLAYIIGSVPFCNTNIFLDSHPLIPRPETEFWVAQVITSITSLLQDSRKALPQHLSEELDVCPKQAADDCSPLQVLDLCAGSGCIGVAIQAALPTVLVDFAEIDPTHLPTIKKNLAANTTDTTNQTTQSDLFQNITGKYHFIVTNPPYIDPAIDRAEPSVKLHEPHLALYGGCKGVALIKKLITEAPTHLHPHGELWLEHEPEQSEAITSLGKKLGFDTTTHQDQYGVERYSILVLQ